MQLGLTAAEPLDDPPPEAAGPGERIGGYRILETLGEGGMGIVYLAEQVEPFRRQVALKVIKIGMNTREVVARFEAERQALAMMSHSHIAQIFGDVDTYDVLS
jgi:serine/threonine protein kinase